MGISKQEQDKQKDLKEYNEKALNEMYAILNPYRFDKFNDFYKKDKKKSSKSKI